MTGSGSIGSTSSMGLSGSSCGCSTRGGSVKCSIEECSHRWIFQGTRGATGGKLKDG